MNDIDNDSLSHIFEYLPTKELLVAMQTCRAWHAMIFSNDNLIRFLYSKLKTRVLEFLSQHQHRSFTEQDIRDIASNSEPLRIQYKSLSILYSDALQKNNRVIKYMRYENEMFKISQNVALYALLFYLVTMSILLPLHFDGIFMFSAENARVYLTLWIVQLVIPTLFSYALCAYHIYEIMSLRWAAKAKQALTTATVHSRNISMYYFEHAPLLTLVSIPGVFTVVHLSMFLGLWTDLSAYQCMKPIRIYTFIYTVISMIAGGFYTYKTSKILEPMFVYNFGMSVMMTTICAQTLFFDVKITGEVTSSWPAIFFPSLILIIGYSLFATLILKRWSTLLNTLFAVSLVVTCVLTIFNVFESYMITFCPSWILGILLLIEVPFRFGELKNKIKEDASVLMNILRL